MAARDDFDIRFTGLDEVEKQLAEYERLFDAQIIQIVLRATTNTVITRAKELAPVDMGNLRRQIFARVTEIAQDSFGIAAGSWSDYAYHVHEGADYTHFQPAPGERYRPPAAMIEGLKPWAKRVLGDEGAAWGVAVNMIKRGKREPDPYLLNAMEEMFDRFVEQVFNDIERLAA